MLQSIQGAPRCRGAPSFFSPSDAIASVALGAALLVLYLLYAAAFGFGSSFDDDWNLAGLSSVSDRDTALEFVFGGISGPLGRPLALLSFLPRAASWPTAPHDFLYENALLHLVNVLLLSWLALRLAAHLPWRIGSPQFFAVSVGVWWGASPLLFSTSAMIIQRMTSLSTLFCLLGCLGYVAAWERLARQPRAALILMTLSVGTGTLLATLCKENGALLPGFLLILDRVLLAQSPTSDLVAWPARQVPWYRWWRIGLLWLPTVAVLIYLTMNVPYFIDGHRSRAFTFGERLLTESRILLHYLKLLLLPVRSALGPYHDDFAISTGLLSPPGTLIAVLGLALAALFGWIWRRGRLRLFTFAAAWFIWGHVTESTVVPLELYFEHRNYLPAVGVVLALTALLFHPLVGGLLRTSAVALVLGSSLFVLRETALLWGERPVAAATWYQHHPDSLRALQFYLVVLYEEKRIDEYVAAIDNVRAPLRDGAEYAMLRLAAACNFRDAAAVADAAQIAITSLRTGYFNPTVTDLLDKLVDMASSNACKGLTLADTRAMLDAIIANESPRIRDDMRAQAHEIYARLTIPDHDLSATMHHLEQAFRLRPTLSTGIAMAGVLVSAQLYDEADRKLDELAPFEPQRPFVHQRWLDTVREMREIILRERLERPAS